jgi:hypothetical protein
MSLIGARRVSHFCNAGRKNAGRESHEHPDGKNEDVVMMASARIFWANSLARTRDRELPVRYHSRN